MLIQKLIQAKLTEELAPQHLEVINESAMHNVPPGSESHFKVLIVSQAFESLSRVTRHQRIYQILAREMKESIHALALQTYTPQEWAERNQVVEPSPPCEGGSQA
jgi:BolA protein